MKTDRLEVEQVGSGVRFRVKVVTRARQQEIAGVQSGVLRLRLKAPPVAGKANEALISLLAGGLQVPRASVKIAAGARSTLKTILVTGVSAESVRARLEG